jgi:carboxylesterase
VPFLRKPFRDIQDREARRGHVSYLRSPVDATASVLELAGIVRRELSRIRIPALVIQARRDHVVHVANARYIHARLGSPRKSLLILNRGFHIVTVDRDRRRVFEAVARFVRNA